MPNINRTSLNSQLQTIINGLTLASETRERLATLLKSAQYSGANASTIITQLESRISSVTTSESLQGIILLAVSSSLTSEDRELSVATIGDLPTTVQPGSIYFVNSENLPYIRRLNGTWAQVEFNSQPPINGNPNAYAWGSAQFGRLGDNTEVSKSSPVSVVGGFAGWVQISASQHTVAIRANGTAWAWGLGSTGQLGDNTANGTSSPVSVVGGFTDWVQIEAGGQHTAAIRANGTAWCWGGNAAYGPNFGELGNNAQTNRSSPVSVVGGFTEWVQISAGRYHTAAIRKNGTAWAWGSSSAGQLGDNTTVSKSSPVSVVGGFVDWVQISAGGSHSVGVRANGTAWAWGSNGYGHLGNNTQFINVSSPVSVVGGFTDWVQISAGYGHTAAIRANGTAWAWGSAANGLLGDGTTVSKSSPVSVLNGFTDWAEISAGRYHTAALRANGTAWCWGFGGAGQIGENSAINRSSPQSVVGGFTDWVQISTGRNMTAALRA